MPTREKLEISIREARQGCPASHLEAQIDAKVLTGQKDPEVKFEIDGLRQRLSYWQKQKDQINTGKWRPAGCSSCERF